MKLIDRSVRGILDDLSSAQPTPGGGSASALASAAGASLLMMVASLPKTRSGSDADRAALDAARVDLTALREQLADAIDKDAAAYDAVVAAFKLPKTSDAEQQARRRAIDAAMAGAIAVPLAVMRLTSEALRAAAIVARHGNRSAASDVGVAVALLRAGLHGARLNVDINVASLKDEARAQSARADAARFEHEGRSAAAEAEAGL
jgi:methenyltetrahydrofolate cyclohydrolase